MQKEAKVEGATFAEGDRETEVRSGWRQILKLGLLAAIFFGGIAIFRWTPLAEYVNARAVAEFFRGLGDPWWSPVVFVPLYALATAIGVPGSVPTLAGGAIYGVARGMLYNTIGANLGALAAFLLARYLGRDFVVRVLKGRAADLDERIGEHGFSTILYLRLIPLIPFNALNYAAGVSRVSLRDYVLGSFIGMLPGTLVYTYFADALIRGTAAARKEAFLHFALAAGALVLFTLITGWVRRRLGAKVIGEED